MNINNVTQFLNYTERNNLTELSDIFRQIRSCLKDFNRRCVCHNKADKDRIYNRCNVLYLSGAREAANQFKTQFLNCTPDRSISFLTETGTVIVTLNR